jgi:hypothetical protein
MSNQYPITQSIEEDTPYGFCHCGCGNKTTIRKKNHALHKCVKGEPAMFLPGHSGRLGPTLKERLESKISMEPMTGCWLWTGFCSPTGYGHIGLNNVVYLVSRMAWQIYRGPIPEGMDVCHTCDTPQCASPHHLFLGTHTDNLQDAVKKGRMSMGEKVHWAKLKEAQVIAVREDTRHPRIIAEEYGVVRGTIELIRKRKTWKHI